MCVAVTGVIRLPSLVSQRDHLEPAGDLLGGDQLALAGAGAGGPGPLPVLGRGHVTVPERPSPALPRADRVNGTAPGAVVKDAVAVGLLAQAALAVHRAGVQPEHLFRRLAAVPGDRRDFLVVDPDDAGRAGAAIAAAGT